MDDITFVRSYNIGWGSPYVVTGTILGAPHGGAIAPGVQMVISQSYDASKWGQKLHQMESLPRGWNGYDAPSPSNAAITIARGFLSNLLAQKFEPSRLAPSSVGGVGFTHKVGDRRVYVEFFNDGQVCALFTDGKNPPRSRRVQPVYDEFRGLIGEIRDYLDA